MLGALFHRKHEQLYTPIKQWITRLGFMSEKRESFYAQLQTLLAADVSLYESLKGMRDNFQTYRTHFKSFNTEITLLNDAIYRMDAGLGTDNIGELFEGYIPRNELTILSIDASKQRQALEQAGIMMKQFNTLKSEVLKMLATPFISLLMIIVLMILSNSMIFPMLLKIFPLSDMPAITVSLYHFCHFFVVYSIPALFVFIVLTITIIWSLPNWVGQLRRVFDMVLPFNLYKQLQSTAFMISLTLLLQAGEDFTTSLKRLDDTASRYLKEIINHIESIIFAGKTPGQALASSHLFSIETKTYLNIFDQAGALRAGLKQMSEKGLSLQIQAIRKTMSVLAMIMLVLSVGFTGWFYAAVGEIGIHSGTTTQISHNT